MTASVSNTYFATDGSYGSASKIVLTDTSSWTDAMWELIDLSTDSDRRAVAQHFADNDHEFLIDEIEGVERTHCAVCELSKRGLGIAE